MAGAFELPLRIPLRPSRRQAALLYFAHLGAIPILLATGLPPLVTFLLIGAVAVNLHVAARALHLQPSARRPVEVLLNPGSDWYLILNDGEVCHVTLEANVYVHPWLVILPFRHGSRRVVVVLTPDVVDEDTFRRLRVRVKYK